MPKLDNSAIEVMSSTLQYPEGPIHCIDGSIILVEIRGEKLSIVPPEGGNSKQIAHIPGGPNGAAIGKDGNIYICNDGGFEWADIPLLNGQTISVSGNQPKGADYIGGMLQRVDPSTGSVTNVYTECTERAFPPPGQPKTWSPPFELRGLDDLVVDEAGGIWFTDYGKQRPRDKDITAVYYVSPDGSSIKQMIYPLNSPNGIGLSPCGKKLYVALTFESKVLSYDIPEPGVIEPNAYGPKNPDGTIDGSHLLTANLPGESILDSMALDAEGNVYVATMLPNGLAPMSNGGISVISPDGEVEFIPITLPDGKYAPMPSNICFGGKDMKTAYVTCGASGNLLKMPATIPGLELNFNGSNFDASKVKR